MNLTKRGADVLVAHLASNPPEHSFVAKRLQFRGRAKALSIASDNLNSEIDRVRVSRMGLLNALLSERTVKKTGVRAGSEMVKINGRLYNPGQPYCKVIDNDDHGFDFTARCIEEMRWERHKYRVQREILYDCGLFNPRELDKISMVWDQNRSSSAGEQAMSHLIGGEHKEEAFIHDMVELMDVVFYDADGTTWVCTCASDPDETSDWLRIEQWSGPERGPFEWLQFYPVPNNIMGIAWATVTEVQAVIASKIMRKIVDSALAAKAGLMASGQVDDKEIRSVIEGPDGFVLKVADPNAWSEKKVGGEMAQDLWKILGPVMEWWNIQSGNVDVLGGTDASSGSDTLGEYQGMAANAGVVMSYLQKVSHEHEEAISRRLAFYLQNDPLRKFMSPHRVPNGEWLEVVYDPFAEEDDHTDYEYRIRDNSMKAVDPNVLLHRLMEFYGIFLPTGALQIPEAARVFGDLAGIDDMDALVPDQMWQMENEMAMQGIPPPVQGQVAGMPQGLNPAMAQGMGAGAPPMGQPGPGFGAMPPPGMGAGMPGPAMQGGRRPPALPPRGRRSAGGPAGVMRGRPPMTAQAAGLSARAPGVPVF